MHRHLTILIAALLALAPHKICAASSPTDLASIRPRLRHTSDITLKSAQGLAYHLRLSVPLGPPPPGGFPTVYVLDGDAWFGAAVEIARIREWSHLAPAIIIGIGYPHAVFFDERRSDDFVPDFPGPEGGHGGVERFLAFLTGVAQPWVGTHFPINPRRQALFGHSLGGLFTLHAMFVAPASFATFIVASAPLRMGDHAVLKDEATFLGRLPSPPPRVMITVGGFETKPSPELEDDYRRYFREHPAEIAGKTPEQAVAELFPTGNSYDKAADLKSLADRLRHAGLDARFVLFPNEDHTPAGIDALNDGIAFALRPGTP